MNSVLVDSNVILDVATNDSRWAEWSAARLEELANETTVVVNPIIYSEVSIGFDRIEDVERALPADLFRREALPWEATFLAGKCFLRYRRSAGVKRAPLPDFYVGAHAAVSGHRLLTRDAARYRTYFPRVELITP
jgi:predicted nucleic acid-binding protein